MATQSVTREVSPRTVRLAGWPLVGWNALAVFVVVGGVLGVRGTDEVGWRAVIRATALTSLLLFTSAFVASALRRTWRMPLSRWLLANRRYFGVSFAVSHAMHLVGILVVVFTVPTFHSNPTTVVLGGFGYVLIAAMTATSFDRSAAWLGPRAWKRLHTFGVYYLWFIFFATYAPQIARSGLYVFHTGVLFAALALRLYGRRTR